MLTVIPLFVKKFMRHEAKRLLGYDPQFSMRQGLKEAVKWYWNNL